MNAAQLHVNLKQRICECREKKSDGMLILSASDSTFSRFSKISGHGKFKAPNIFDPHLDTETGVQNYLKSINIDIPIKFNSKIEENYFQIIDEHDSILVKFQLDENIIIFND